VTEPAFKAKTREFRDNYDRIFAKKRKKRPVDIPPIDDFLNDELMTKGEAKKWVKLEDIVANEKKGWRRVE